MNTEFDVIKKYFTFPALRDDVELAVGDDCAIVSVPENKKLLLTTDTLISGVHFPQNTPAKDIAYKAIMVNLSDLAAMGATPAWLSLAISLPEINEVWLTEFSTQFSALLSQYNISLVGGDTTKGHLSITIQAMGFCEQGNILRRDKAQPGDKVYVSGSIGDAAIGLHAIVNELADNALLPCIQRLNRPQARINFAAQLSTCSQCAIDISDGLVADLGHVLHASGCGAQIRLDDIPLSLAARYYFDTYCHQKTDWPILLTRGDDYELCFTVNEKNQSAVEALAKRYDLVISCIGEVTDSTELSFLSADGEVFDFEQNGFQHF